MAIKNGWKQHISNFHFTEGYVKTKVYYKVIFDPEFAKAFFGSGTGEHVKESYLSEIATDYKIDEDLSADKIKIPKWQYHMGRYVIMENPIEYFAKYI